MTKHEKIGMFAGLAALAVLSSCATSPPGPVYTIQAPAPQYHSVELQPIKVRHVNSVPQQTVQSEPAPVKQYYDVPLTEDLQDYIMDLCADHEVSEKLVLAVISVESSYRSDVISETSDYGLMQINVCNHGWLSREIGIDNFLDPKQNIRAGVYMLSALVDKYEDLSQALMAYNCGDGGAKDLWNQGITETTYSKKVLQAMEDLQFRAD